MEVRLATEEEIENWWNKKIQKRPHDNAYKVWKSNFVVGNKRGERKTFFAFENGQYIGQGTLLLKSKDKVMTGKGRAEIIKLEVEKKWRGQGVSSQICHEIERYAKVNGIDTLTIGVEPCEVRNMQIYFHWGFTTFLQVVTETYPPKTKSGKGETITVLCYEKKI